MTKHTYRIVADFESVASMTDFSQAVAEKIPRVQFWLPGLLVALRVEEVKTGGGNASDN